MMHHPSATRLKVAAIALFCAGGGLSVSAQDASPWNGEVHAEARLIAGGAVKTAGTEWKRAGIEIRLDPGWKTYWRYPGDSGVPPTLDFAGSENVKSVTALWPAPERFDDGAGGHSIGYHGDVVLPLRIAANDASKPTLLHVTMGYAACGNICVPVQAQLDLTLSGEASTEEPALVAAEARVPRRIALGANRDFGIASVHREADGTHERVVVDVAAPDGAPVDLFVEGPTPEWVLPLPEPIVGQSGAGRRQFAFDLDGLPQGAQTQGAMLTFTLVSPADAIEVKARLD